MQMMDMQHGRILILHDILYVSQIRRNLLVLTSMMVMLILLDGIQDKVTLGKRGIF